MTDVNTGETQKRTRFIPVDKDVEVLETAVNELQEQGYDISAVSKDYIMLQIPQRNVQLEAIEKLMELNAELPSIPPPGAGSFDPPSDFLG